MRLAALAFGVLAGLVASLILALGGLDVTTLRGIDPRQISLLQFGLLIIANFGMLGAGVALAAPLAGAILLTAGALAWLLAALVLQHGADYVLITPTALLLIAAGIALVAFLRDPRRRDDRSYGDPRRVDRQPSDDPLLPPFDPRVPARQPAPEPAYSETPDDDDEPPATRVSAGFFGQGGTATPVRVEAGRPPQPALRSDDRVEGDEDWRPGRRQPPPRLKPMFRQPVEDDEDEDEEPGLSRAARSISSILSFGLYAALAGAAILVVLNWRLIDRNTPAATMSSSSVATADTASAAAPLAPVLSSASSAPGLPVPASSSELPREDANLITAEPALNDTAMVAPAPVNDARPAGNLQPLEDSGAADAATPETPGVLFPGTVVASPEPDALAAPATAAEIVQPLPFEMPAAIAAERAGGRSVSRRPPATTTPARGNDTGI